MPTIAYLLFPILELFNKEVVAFRDFGNFTVHSSLEMDIILPRLIDFSCESVLLPNHLVEMSHADFGHDWLLLATLEDRSDTGVASGFLTDMVDNVHDSVLIPPFWVLDILNLSTHHLSSERRSKVHTIIGPEGCNFPSGYASRRKRGGPVNATVA